MEAMPRFDSYMARLLPSEGGYSDRRDDPGNWTGGQIGVGILKGTKYGIAANTYPHLNIKALTWEQAKAIYLTDFWNKVRGDALPGAVAYSALDGAINSGPQRSIMWLQYAARVADDGLWGPVTMAAIKKADANDLVLRYNSARLEFMTRLKNWPVASRGWARRIAHNLSYAAEDN